MRTRRLWLLTGLLVIVTGLSGFSLRDPADDSFPPDGMSVRLATANVYYRNQQGQRIAEQVGQVAADVVVLFECTDRNVSLENLRSEGRLALAVDGRSTGPEGICVLASSDVHLEAEIMPAPVAGPCEMPFATLRLRVGESRLSILAVHAPPPVARCQGSNRATIEKLASWIRHGRLVRSVGRCRERDPVVLLGDLNAFSFSRPMRGIRQAGMVDAYSASSRWPGPTWSPRVWLPPLARIDYILIPSGFRAGNGRVSRLQGSDHRMVSVDLYLEGRTSG